MSEAQTQTQNTDADLTRKGGFWSAAYTIFILLTGTNLPTPLYRGYEQMFGHTTLVTTLIFAAYVAALVPALLIGGPLSDSIGRRRVLLPSVGLAIAGSAVFSLASSTAWLFTARILQGLAVGAASGALTAVLNENEPTGNRRRAAFVTTVASLGGLGVGPLVAGVLAQYAPAPFVTSFVLEIAFLLIALTFMTSLPDSSTRTRWRLRRPSIPVGMGRVFAVSGSANFLAFGVVGLSLSLVPAYVLKLSGITNLAVAGTTVTLMLACSIGAQIAGYGKSPLKLLGAGLILLLLGLVTLIVAGHAMSLPLLIVASVAAGLGHGLIFLGGMTEINRLAPRDKQAETASAFFVIVYLGVGMPVIGAGFLATVLGSLMAVQIFAAALIPLTFGALLLLFMNHRELGRNSSGSCITS
ncbi:MAG: MFS transporter [Hyphomicrobiales bacterium]|nr:MFS transporter [Hyphomicrobiales bacterium]